MNVESYLKERIKSNTFLHYIGFELVDLAQGKVLGKLPMRDALRQQDGFAHGGVIASILDMAAGFASYSLLEPPQRCLTVEIKVSYYNPSIQDVLWAEGIVEKVGRRIHFCESKVWDSKDNNTVIAKATATMAII